MAECADAATLNQEILNACSELIGRILGEGQLIASRHGLPVFAVKAMHWLDGGLAMKELGQRLRCDPSFVTSVADALEQRGLARREPDPADRRVKNLVLTPEGRELKQRLERELLASMPWCTALDPAERQTLLTLVRKLVAATPPGPAEPLTPAPQLAGAGHPGEVTG